MSHQPQHTTTMRMTSDAQGFNRGGATATCDGGAFRIGNGGAAAGGLQSMRSTASSPATLSIEHGRHVVTPFYRRAG